MDFLYDTPWWLLLLLFAIGGLFAWSGYSKRDKLIGGIGLSLLLAGIALYALSRMVETDPKQVVRRSGELVAAVERGDWTGVGTYLEPNATVSMPGSKNFCEDRQQVLTKGKKYAEMAGTLRLNVTRIDPKPQGTQYTTEVSVYISASRGEGTNLTVWRFTWHREGKVWMVQAIEAIQLGLDPGKGK
jgi:hypothetical protein